MNSNIQKQNKHRKSMSEISSNSYNPRGSDIINLKIKHLHNKSQQTNPSTEKNEKNFIQNKITNSKHKQACTSNNSRKLSSRSIDIYRSSSFDKYSLLKSKDKLYDDIVKTLKPINQINAKYYKRKRENEEMSSMLTQPSSLNKKVSFPLVFNSQSRPSQKYPIQLNKASKIVVLKSPFTQKHLEMKIKLPIETQINKKGKPSISFQEWPQCYGSLSKINSITVKYPQTEANARKELNGDKVALNQMTKGKKNIQIYHTKITKNFNAKKQVTPGYTQPSNTNHLVNSNILSSDTILQLSEKKPKRNLKKQSRGCFLKYPTPKNQVTNDNLIKKVMKEEGPVSNEINTIIYPEIKKRKKCQNKVDTIQEEKWRSPEAGKMDNIDQNKNNSSSISSIYQDIIRNNINFNQKNNCNTLKISNTGGNITPLINKYMHLYPTQSQEYDNGRKGENDTLIDKISHIPQAITNINLMFSNDIKNAIWRNKKNSDKDMNTSGGTVKDIQEDDNGTDYLFEDEEGIEKQKKFHIPFITAKHLSSYNHTTEISMTPLMHLFKIPAISSAIISFLDKRSLNQFSKSSIFLRNKLKISQNERIISIIFDSNHNETRGMIRKSVWFFSDLPKEVNSLHSIYLDNLNKKSVYDEEIRKDLSRTFPNDVSFKSGNCNYIKLYNLLTAYSNYNQKIGYAQGLNFLVANALPAFDKEYEIFIFIDGLIKKFNLEQLLGVANILNEKLDEIGMLLHKFAFDVMKYLDSLLLGHEFFTANWLLTLFSNSMRKQHLFYVWDLMIIYGREFLNYFIVAIMIKYTDKILQHNQSFLSHLMKGLLKSESFDQDLQLIIENTLKLMRVYCI